MKLKYFLFSIIIFAGIIFANVTKAVCPVCIVAVGAGLGFSRWFGVDDVISSLWIGALLASISWWTIIWLNKKGWDFKFQKIIIPAAYYLLTLLPLYFIDIVGHPLNKIFGIDKIILGSFLGTTIFLATVWFHNFLKTKNSGKSFFPYQRVAVPVSILIIISLILWRII